MNNPIVISVAPNGSYKTKKDHPGLPISPEELAIEAKNCQKAGATLIHLHVRNQEEKHTLDIAPYKEAISAIREAVGNNMIIQATTEATGIYSPSQQMDMVRELKPEAISMAIKELIPEESDEDEAKEFLEWMLAEKISPQYVVYSAQELERFYKLKRDGIVPGQKHFVLFVLGRYSAGQESSPKDIMAFIDTHLKYNTDNNVQWAICAFGKSEAECMQAASMLGGHVRIGFENNMYLADGSLAPSNAELIKQFSNLSPTVKRSIATIEQSKELVLC
jgi:3-keto-5-aminohexanoate cleavage enzyme